MYGNGKGVMGTKENKGEKRGVLNCKKNPKEKRKGRKYRDEIGLARRGGAAW